MNSYFKTFLGQEKTIELLGVWSPLSCKDKFKKIKNWLKNQSLLSIDQKKELEVTPALEEGPVASTSSKTAPKTLKANPKRNSEEKEQSNRPSGQGKRQRKLAKTIPTGVLDPQIGACSHGKCSQYGQYSYGMHSQ
ncbi:hypothetical protein O181_108682 [Austropuccinia psidii MF-1]|uniref:Uncharacterized protein n=1 Tax=Austropuccinia psidii MF-1 TaxID=1389203 RepID=A0A9Q3JWD2_9BASI|nr:hypothetical protein [Austropuccinia psidii MF-1]